MHSHQSCLVRSKQTRVLFGVTWEHFPILVLTKQASSGLRGLLPRKTLVWFIWCMKANWKKIWTKDKKWSKERVWKSVLGRRESKTDAHVGKNREECLLDRHKATCRRGKLKSKYSKMMTISIFSTGKPYKQEKAPTHIHLVFNDPLFMTVRYSSKEDGCLFPPLYNRGAFFL